MQWPKEKEQTSMQNNTQKNKDREDEPHKNLLDI
jgi:hypothetical protein